MTEREALNMALQALETLMIERGSIYDKAITAIKEALAQQDSKDKEQAKTDSFVRQLDEALAQPNPWEKFCDSNCVWTDHHPDCKLAEQEPFAFLHPQKGFYFAKPTKISAPTIVDVEPLFLYTTPPQRKPLPPQSPCEMTQAEGKMFKLGWLECEAAHGIKE